MKQIQYTCKTMWLKMMNSKVGVFLLLLLITAWSYDKPYLEFVKEKNYPISWCIFPFFMTDYGFLTLFYFGIIYVNSDVPFLQHENMYQIIRTGRIRWSVGQTAGIFLRSFLLVIITAVAAFLPFVGNIELSNEWGKVIHTLAAQDTANLSEFIAGHGDQINFSFAWYEVFDKYTPVQLMFLCILICTLICTFLGLFMFMISLFAERVFAVVGAFSFILLLFFVENAYGSLKQKMSYFAPVHWAEFAASATPVSGYYRMPSLAYIVTFLFVSNAAMAVIIGIRIKHMEFNWENEDA